MEYTNTEIQTEADWKAELFRMLTDGRARRIRKDNGLSTATIGRSVGASTSAVQRWENGDRMPTGDPGKRYYELLKRLDKKED